MKDEVLKIVNAAKAKIQDETTRTARIKLEDIYSRKEKTKKMLKNLELEEKMLIAELEDEIVD